MSHMTLVSPSTPLGPTKLVDRQTTGEPRGQLVPGPGSTRAPSQHRGPEQDGLDATPSIGPGLGGADQTRTEGPTPRPRQPTAGTVTTEPPFIGDVYLSEEDRPQSVSLPLARFHRGCRGDVTHQRVGSLLPARRGPPGLQPSLAVRRTTCQSEWKLPPVPERLVGVAVA